MKLSEIIEIATPVNGFHWSGISNSEITSFCKQNGIKDMKSFCQQLMKATKTQPGHRVWLRSGFKEDVILDLYWMDIQYCIDRKEDIGGGIEYFTR